MSNSIVGLVSFLFTMTLEEELNKIKLSTDPTAEIQFSSNERKKIVSSKIENAASFDELPDMLIRSDFKGLSYKTINESMDSGLFENVMPDIYSNNSYSIEVTKNKKGLTLLGGKPWVIVVDRSINKNILSPTRWSDLLDSRYENKIGIQGKKDKFCGTLLLYTHKDHGKEGLEALGRNIKNVWHFTDIIKTLGKGSSTAAPINIMPLTNAMMIVNREPIEIIWPEEGALATPIYMLVKKEKVEELDSYIKYLTGREFETLLSRNHIHSTRTDLRDKKLKWLGWEYINNLNLPYEEHKNYLNKIFRDVVSSKKI